MEDVDKELTDLISAN